MYNIGYAMRTRYFTKAIWAIDKAASAALLDGKKEIHDGMQAAKKILLQVAEDEKNARILRREKRKKNLAERA